MAIVGNAHVVCALPNGITVEVDRSGNPMVDELLIEPLQIREGMLQLSRSPGLGIEVNETLVEQLRLPAGTPVPDGTFSDMFFDYSHRADDLARRLAAHFRETVPSTRQTTVV